MTDRIDEVLFNRSSNLTTTMGYKWFDVIPRLLSETYEEFDYHPTGVAALLADVQTYGPQFVKGAVVADFGSELESRTNANAADRAKFEMSLVDTIREALPGHYPDLGEDEDRNLDSSLLLTIYGALADRLSFQRKAHVVDSDVQGGKIAIFGDTRSATSKFADRVLNQVKVFGRAVSGSTASTTAESNDVYIDDVAVAAIKTVSTYTEMVVSGELDISNERGLSIFHTMSMIKVCLDVHCPEWQWDNENEGVLLSFDDTMVAFQEAVVTRLPVPEAPRPSVGM